MKLCIRICLQVVLAGGLWGAVSQELAPEVLLEKYNLCNKKFQTIYYELETTNFESLRPGKRVHSFKYCSHNEKKQWIGHRTQYNKDGTIDQNSSGILRDIYSDKWGVHLQYYNPELKSKHPPSADLVRSSRDKCLQSYVEHPPYGGSLTGRFFGSNAQSIYDLLKRAPNLKLNNEVTKITGYDTYLIEADTKYGLVKAWISPDLEYNCLKWEIIKAQNQYYRDGSLTNDKFTKWTAVFDAEKVEQIDGHYFITQAGLNYKVDNGDIAIVNNTYRFNLKNIDLSPDYEALGAFEIQLPEGTVVRDEDIPGIQYQWIGGKLQPLIDDVIIDAIDSAVYDLKKNKKTIPEKQVEKPRKDGSVKQAAKADGNQLSNREITKIETREKNSLWTNTNKLVCCIISVFLALVIGFYVYRRRSDH